MPTVTTKRFEELTAIEFHDLLRLRIDVFVVEQACPYPELDGRDTEATTLHHWIAADDGPPCCYARSLGEPDGSRRIGRVVTSPEARGGGLAASLMDQLIERLGTGVLVLDAQSHLAEWYTCFGFEVAGEEFVEDGIPHIPMHRTPSVPS